MTLAGLARRVATAEPAWRVAAAAWLAASSWVVGDALHTWMPITPLAAGLALAGAALPWRRLQDVAAVPQLAVAVLVPLGLLPGVDHGATALLTLLPLLWLATLPSRRPLLLSMAVACAGSALGAASGDGIAAAPRTAAMLAIVLAVRRLVAGERAARRAALTARLDPLSGAAAAAWWHEELESLLARARSGRSPVCLVLLQLDGVAAVAHHGGRAASEAVIAETAAAWRQSLLPGEMLGRSGDAEFVLLLPDRSRDEAVDAVERLATGVPQALRLRAGMAMWDGEEDAAALVARADADLHQPHERGRPEGRPDWSEVLPGLVAERRIEAVYQPIRRLDDGSVIGYEAFARPHHETGGVQGMFAAARRLGLGAELDGVCLQAAVQGAAGLPAGSLLFVNVGSAPLRDHARGLDQLRLLMRWSRSQPSDVVLDVHEEEVRDLGGLVEALAAYRAAGYRLCLSGVGDGTSTLEALAATRPEFVKLSRGLTVDSEARGAFGALRAVLEFARVTGAAVIAQSLETEEEVARARSLGLALGQGWALGRPAAPALLDTRRNEAVALGLEPAIPDAAADGDLRVPVIPRPAPVAPAEDVEVEAPARRRRRPASAPRGALLALAVGLAVAAGGSRFPSGLALPWVAPVVDGLMLAILGVVALLGYTDAVSRSDGRRLPVANAAVGSAVLWLFPLLSTPGVLPDGLVAGGAAAHTVALGVARLVTATLLLWALLQDSDSGVHVRVAALRGLGISLTCGALCATLTFATTPVLAHADSWVIAQVGIALDLTAALPAAAAAAVALRRRGAERSITGAEAGAAVLLVVEALTAAWARQVYSAAWYADVVVRVLPPLALLVGQITVYRRAVDAEMDSLAGERERIRELTLLQEAARALSSSLDRGAIIAATLRYAAAVRAGRRTCAHLLDVSRRSVTVLAEHDPSQVVPFEGLSVPVGPGSSVRRAMLTGRPQWEPPVDQGFEGLLRAAGVVQGACVPVRCGVLTVGVLHVGVREGGPFTAGEIRLLEGLAHLAGLSLANAESYKRLAAIAASDPLTGLGNRREFERALAAVEGARFAVLAIDVDNLKVINDTYGHEAGDATIKSVAAVLRAGLRQGDVIARTGGDEFAALLPYADETEAVAVAERLRHAMRGVPTPNGLGSISVGCAWTAAGGDAKELWNVADEALYRAKRGGRNQVATGHVDPTAAPDVRSPRWENAVEDVLARRGVDSVYQPIVDLGDGRITGYEALARPVGTPPEMAVDGLFAAAQRLGFGPDLDWLCRRSAVQNAHALPAGAALFINVGVSALVDPLHGVDQMLLLLRWARRRPQDVVLEITEREAVRDLERFEEVVAAYRAHGFRFALDDVGEGHSTFELLAAVAPEFVKISAKLVHRRGAAAAHSAIRGIVAFAGASGAQVIAEGVEDADDREVMVALGVPLGQGWALGLPASAADLGGAAAVEEIPAGLG